MMPGLTLAVACLQAAPTRAAEKVRVETKYATYVFSPDDLLLSVELDGATIPLLRHTGPGWEVEGEPRSAAGVDVRVVESGRARDGKHYVYSVPSDELQWWLAIGRGSYADVSLSLGSGDPRITHALPGTVPLDGEWTGLDLSQYQLAHGQPYWPKTYYLRDHNLFLCAWWDWDVSSATDIEWPEEACGPREGTGAFAPAAAMRYVPGPDGERAPLRETLHVRVSRDLWDAALPSLCRPSEYRREMAGMVYFEFWGAEPAERIEYALSRAGELVGPYVRLLTVVQNWEAGGWDALLPDSIWLPDYPPNPSVGTVEELREVADLGNALGRIAFRTNYMLLRRRAPSFVRGQADFALEPDGGPRWHTQPSRWLDIASRQEDEIQRLWAPSAAFTDQLASGGGSWAYLDFGDPAGAGRTIGGALARQRALARLLKRKNNGPLGSETLNQQDLIGYYCDFGDFCIMDGHHRLFSPEYKLRRLQEITVNYGCGLHYRFFELPPFNAFHSGTLDLWSDPGLMDDYRCCEVMLGNGGYVWDGMPWEWALTELILIGRLQRHYALVPIKVVEYLTDDGWRTLEEMVRSGFVLRTRPWNQKQPEMGRVRVEYRNGLWVYVNRLPDDLAVDTPAGTIVLPQYGWVAFRPDGSLLAYSAYRPGTEHRADFLEERASGLRFINPRGETVDGSADVRLWRDGGLLWSVNPETDTATVKGESVPLNPPQPAPLRGLQFEFGDGLAGWRATHGVLRVTREEDGAGLLVCDPDPQVWSPPLRVDGRAGDVVELMMSTDAGEEGQLYFATSEDGVSGRQVVSFPVQADGERHTIAVSVGQHERWAGRTITRIRLDPVHGPESAHVVLYSLRLRRGQ